MNIDNNSINSTNVSNLIASSISKLSLNSVKKADSGISINLEVKNSKEEIKKEEVPIIPDEKSKMTVDIKDIQKYANMVGENVTVDDINYGIMYGRSVIADYIA